MSMSTEVIGFRPADDKWKKMKAIWDACKAGDAPAPSKVIDFFGGEDPGDKPGMEVHLGGALTDWCDEYRRGFEVDLSKLPPDIKVLRFYNSW